MERFVREAEGETPYILLDPSGHIWIRGRSFPHDASRFYEPVLEWMKGYVEAAPEETLFTVDLESFNIGSSKYLLYMIYHLQELARQGRSVKVSWVHDADDEDMIEVGQDYEAMAGIPFHFVIRSPQQDLARSAMVSSS